MRYNLKIPIGIPKDKAELQFLKEMYAYLKELWKKERTLIGKANTRRRKDKHRKRLKRIGSICTRIWLSIRKVDSDWGLYNYNEDNPKVRKIKDELIQEILDRRDRGGLPTMGESMDDRAYKKWLSLKRPDITYAEFCTHRQEYPF